MEVSLKSGTTCDWVERNLCFRLQLWLNRPSICGAAGGSAAVCVCGRGVCV